MKDLYKELKEDVTDEEKAIDETLERLLRVRDEFDSKNRNFLVEPTSKSTNIPESPVTKIPDPRLKHII